MVDIGGRLTRTRTRCLLQKTSNSRPAAAKPCSSGQTVIARESILGQKSASKHRVVILGYWSNEPNSVIRRERECSVLWQINIKLKTSSHVIQAAKALIELDELQANAVAARMELDLRIGAAFTRLQTLQLQSYTSHLSDQPISYGMHLLFCNPNVR